MRYMRSGKHKVPSHTHCPPVLTFASGAPPSPPPLPPAKSASSPSLQAAQVADSGGGARAARSARPTIMHMDWARWGGRTSAWGDEDESTMHVGGGGTQSGEDVDDARIVRAALGEGAGAWSCRCVWYEVCGMRCVWYEVCVVRGVAGRYESKV